MALTTYTAALMTPLSEAVAQRADSAAGPESRDHSLIERQAADQIRLTRVEDSTIGVSRTKVAAAGDRLVDKAAFTAFATTKTLTGPANREDGTDDISVGMRFTARVVINQVTHQGTDTLQLRAKLGTTVIWTGTADEEANDEPFVLDFDFTITAVGATGTFTGTIIPLGMAADVSEFLLDEGCGNFVTLPTPALSIEAVYSANGGGTSNDVDLRQFDMKIIAPPV